MFSLLKTCRVLVSVLTCTWAAIGCQATTSNNNDLESPTLTLDFGQVSSEADFAIIKEKIGEEGSWTDRVVSINLKLPKTFSWQEYSKAAEIWHMKVVGILNNSGVQIPFNSAVALNLQYLSVGASSSSGASIEIEVSGSLFIDSPADFFGLPGVVKNTDESVKLNNGSSFRIALPFAFIQNHKYIYFRGVNGPSIKYYFYDLALQTQKEVAGILKENEATHWKYYQEHHSLPPPKTE